MFKQLLIAIIVIVVIYIIYRVFLKKTYVKISGLKDGNKSLSISADKLPSNNNTSNYTYSIWFYVNDWNYKYGEEKTILTRRDNKKQPSPSITLASIQNNLNIEVTCYPNKKNSQNSVAHNCTIDNVPLQRWVNALISLNGRSLDVYLDGKLVRTCILPGVAKVNTSAPIHITPNGGFSGWTSNIQYWSKSTNPQEAYNIYKAGYGGSILGDFFNKYRLKVSFMEDNVEQSSFEV